MHISTNMFLEWATTHFADRDLHHLAAATGAKHLVGTQRSYGLENCKSSGLCGIVIVK